MSFTMRTVLNIYGVFLILGMLLTIYTHPISIDRYGKVFFDSSIMMNAQEIKGFLSFLLLVGLIYFPAINIYWIKKNRKEKTFIY